MSVTALSKLDLDAAALARSWGVSLTPTVILRPASPCGRRHCGGSVLMLTGTNSCLLCARPGGRDSIADLEREIERQPGLPGLAKAAGAGSFMGAG